MRFRLIYEGELKASQKDPLDKQIDKLAEHKQSIRKKFHHQLRHLWKTNWFLSTHKVFAGDYGVSQSASDTAARWGASPNDMIPLLEAVADNHCKNVYRFVPLVRKNWRLMCSLEILFLRRDPPGSVVHAGDLDNRIKTLIDVFRMPKNPNELRGNERPLPEEDPFFCLLEDDELITGLTVESDRLLAPPTGNKDEDRRQVCIVVTADVRPYDVTTFNLSFA